ncbi:helix-turn-helix transcriptional regulator [Mycobacterium deserti]|nr:LuxR family transcriptional regulator [Mycobacterium deserti]
MRSSVAADLVDLGALLSRAESLEALERTYLRESGQFIDMPIRGLYLLDPRTHLPLRSAGENTSDHFLVRYEQAGRSVDPILSRVLRSHCAVYNLAMMSLVEWMDSQLYQEVVGLHGCRHVIEAPMISAGEVIGTLNFADPRDECAAEPAVEIAELLGRVVGQAVTVVQQRTALTRMSRNALAALDISRTAVIINFSPDEPPWLNDAARELIDGLERGREIAYDAIARPAGREPLTREVPVVLKSGRSGLLRIHSRSPGEEPDAVVAVLGLAGASSPVSGTVWAALSARERQVCELLVEGLTDREIGSRLSLSSNTVSQYVKHIYAKTHTRSRVELTRLVIGIDEPVD